MPKYSQVKQNLRIEITKPEQIDLAYLTHYLQNNDNGVSHYFRDGAVQYLQNLDPEKKADLERLLPVKWDILFPPPKNSKFIYIDLFAGVGGIRLALQHLGEKCVFRPDRDHVAHNT